jgi:disulfide bond formation protein DsbB
MCIVQRYALALIAIIAILACVTRSKKAHLSAAVLLFITSGSGAFVAARQSWLQWFPPDVVSCGRDLYGMIETFPLQRLVPMIFKGSGDCTKVDWTFLGGSIANWSFLCFSAIVILSMAMIWRYFKRSPVF